MSADTGEPETPVEPPPPPLTLRDGLPEVVVDEATLGEVCSAVAAGSGPVALDAERAAGYRYSQRAYLVQLRRAGAGTHLIDPVDLDGLETLDDAIGDSEWILHAATQDLPCLRELGLRPRALFDTELAGRLLDLPRVGLATLVEHFLDHSLAKEHSAVDWSTRPLPEPWLLYAALDVEVLIELRDRLDAELMQAGKREWAAQEFDWLLGFTGPERRPDRWRRTSGIHKARGRRALGLVRELWQTRDAIAEAADLSPSKLLSDAAIVEIATTRPATRGELRSLPTLRRRGARRHLDDWFAALERGLSLPEEDLPVHAPPGDGPPPPRSWPDKRPEAAARLSAARAAITELSEHHRVPSENLVTPDTVRRLAWSPPADLTEESLRTALAEYDARPWQIDVVIEPLTAALRAD